VAVKVQCIGLKQGYKYFYINDLAMAFVSLARNRSELFIEPESAVQIIRISPASSSSRPPMGSVKAGAEG